MAAKDPVFSSRWVKSFVGPAGVSIINTSGTYYIVRKLSHLSEDYSIDKNVASYSERAAIFNWRIENNVLVRDLYLLVNPEGISTDGFYDIEFKILRTNDHPTIRVHDISVLRIKPSALTVAAFRQAIGESLVKFQQNLVPKDINRLYWSKPYMVKGEIAPRLLIRRWNSTTQEYVEYLGESAGKDLFRVFLGNADMERYKIDSTVARGYFCYVERERATGKIILRYAAVDYSIYTK